MTTPVPPWPAGHCPYVTPDQLIGGIWPTGVAWNTLPDTSDEDPATPSQQYAALASICRQATVRVDQITNTPMRSVMTTEELEGPNYRVTTQYASGNGRFLSSRWPVTQVTSMQVSPNNTWPRSWTALPAGNFEPEFPVDGLYGASVPSAGAGGQSILFAPGYLGNCNGSLFTPRLRYRVSATYLSGWPHTCLAAAASAAAGTISVDDCTGWVITGTSGAPIGAAGVIYDALGGGQESIVCTGASATSGPGTLTLASPLNFAHDSLIAVSSLPETVIWAAALLAGAAALSRGATATTIQTTSGRSQGTSLNPLVEEAKLLLSTFRRTV